MIIKDLAPPERVECRSATSKLLQPGVLPSPKPLLELFPNRSVPSVAPVQQRLRLRNSGNIHRSHGVHGELDNSGVSSRHGLNDLYLYASISWTCCSRRSSKRCQIFDNRLTRISRISRILPRSATTLIATTNDPRDPRNRRNCSSNVLMLVSRGRLPPHPSLAKLARHSVEASQAKRGSQSSRPNPDHRRRVRPR